MKFTKQEAFKKLEQFLTNEGKKPLRMSERSLDEQTDKLMSLVATDEMELDEFVEKIKDLVSVSNSNVEKDVSDKIKKWNEEHEGWVAPSAKNKNEPDSDELQNRIKVLEEAYQAEERKRGIEQKKTSLVSKIKEKGVKDEDFVSWVVGEVNFDADLDVEAKANGILELYNKMAAGKASTRTTVPAGSGSASATNPFDYVEKEFDRQTRKTQ